MNHELQKALAQRVKCYRAVLDRAGVKMPGLNQNLDDGPVPETTVEVEGEKGGAVTVRVIGPLDDWFGFDVRKLIAALDAMAPAALNVLIESPGGFLNDGMALYSDFRSRAREGCTIETEARGVVASAAVLPFVAGEQRRVSTGTTVMIHDPWNIVFAMGDSREIRAEVDRYLAALENGEKTLRDVFADRTGNDRPQLDTWLETDTYFTPAEAVEHGFATEVVDDAADQPDTEAQAIAGQVFAQWRTRHLTKRSPTDG